MEKICKKCGEKITINGLGRRRGKYPVQIVLNAFQKHKNYDRVAQETGISKGTVWRIIKERTKEKEKKRIE